MIDPKKRDGGKGKDVSSHFTPEAVGNGWAAWRFYVVEKIRETAVQLAELAHRHEKLVTRHTVLREQKLDEKYEKLASEGHDLRRATDELLRLVNQVKEERAADKKGKHAMSMAVINGAIAIIVSLIALLKP